MVPANGHGRKPQPRHWRERTCTACGAINPAGDFKPVGDYRPGWQSGSIQRRCPDCGRIAQTSDFPVVKEHHTGRDRRGGAA